MQRELGHSLPAAEGETDLRRTDLWEPFEGWDAAAWAMNDGESNALNHLLV